VSIRIIPSILIDGINVVKGKRFINDRVVGNAFGTARLFGKRNVDELIILDVTARQELRRPQRELVAAFSKELNIPFGIGGGIRTVDDALSCIELGAEKIVLGTELFNNPQLVEEIANILGAQAVVGSLDFDGQLEQIRINSGQVTKIISLSKLIPRLEALGCGELLVQSTHHDGLMKGMFLEGIRTVAALSTVPVIASSGVGSINHIKDAIAAGASGVAIGAWFQFTQNTPTKVRERLRQDSYAVRRI
jgi:imidazole glycerol-phosphate synthase subunit HisF